MSFRAKSFIERNEMARFQLDNTIGIPALDSQLHQEKNGYKFTINDRSSICDWYNAYFEIVFEVEKLADGASIGDVEVTVINESHSFINHLMTMIQIASYIKLLLLKNC